MNREELEAYIRNHYATLPDYPWGTHRAPPCSVMQATGNGLR